MTSDLETNIVSVERIKDYTQISQVRSRSCIYIYIFHISHLIDLNELALLSSRLRRLLGRLGKLFHLTNGPQKVISFLTITKFVTERV